MVSALVSIVLLGLCVSFLYLYIKVKGNQDQSCGMEIEGHKIDCFCDNDKSDLCDEKEGNELLKIQKLTALDRDIKE